MQAVMRWLLTPIWLLIGAVIVGLLGCVALADHLSRTDPDQAGSDRNSPEF